MNLQSDELLHEAVAHGNAMFPFMEYSVETDCTREERIYCHWHEELEFLLLIRGHAQLSIGEQSYTIRAGDFALIPPDKLHTMTADPGEKVAFYAFDFAPAFLYSFSEDALQQQYFEPLQKERIIFQKVFVQDCEWKKAIAQRLCVMHDIFQKKKTGYELLLKAKLYEIFALLFSNAIVEKEERHSDRRAELVRAIMQYLHIHYRDNISIKEIGREFHLSEGHLCRLFKEITGRSIVDYLNEYRIRKSVWFLRESSRDIGEIAGLAGFNNISYFNKKFRQYMHTTPGVYRKMMTRDNLLAK